jgi:tetratricopeptide (TPR) repeat protein
VDPQGLTSTLRFEAAWFARDPDRALVALDSAPVEVEGPNTLGEIPKSLFQAEALSLKGNSADARQAYTNARKTLQAMLRTQADNPDPWGSLGLAEAGLGEKAAATQAGRRAAALFPVSKDAIVGPLYLVVLAKIYAQLGEPVPAVKLLDQLLAMPAGRFVSVSLLRLDPIWDPIRNDSGFRALLKRYEDKAHTSSTRATGAGTGAVKRTRQQMRPS